MIKISAWIGNYPLAAFFFFGWSNGDKVFTVDNIFAEKSEGNGDSSSDDKGTPGNRVLGD